jgi:hypothetical protein
MWAAVMHNLRVVNAVKGHSGVSYGVSLIGADKV